MKISILLDIHISINIKSETPQKSCFEAGDGGPLETVPSKLGSGHDYDALPKQIFLRKYDNNEFEDYNRLLS